MKPTMILALVTVAGITASGLFLFDYSVEFKVKTFPELGSILTGFGFLSLIVERFVNVIFLKDANEKLRAAKGQVEVRTRAMRDLSPAMRTAAFANSVADARTAMNDAQNEVNTAEEERNPKFAIYTLIFSIVVACIGFRVLNQIAEPVFGNSQTNETTDPDNKTDDVAKNSETKQDKKLPVEQSDKADQTLDQGPEKKTKANGDSSLKEPGIATDNKLPRLNPANKTRTDGYELLGIPEPAKRNLFVFLFFATDIIFTGIIISGGSTFMDRIVLAFSRTT